MVTTQGRRLGPGGRCHSDCPHLSHVRIDRRFVCAQAGAADVLDNAGGLKNGAPVTLEGVTIGNVIGIHVVPSRAPKSVEVMMRIGEKSLPLLHVDSTTVIAQAGVLGDSYVDITSKKASGPPPPNNSELRSVDTPSIQEVVNSSESALQNITALMGKVDTFFDALNSKKGSAGMLMNDPQLYNKLSKVTTNLETITRTMASGEGSLGKLIKDDTLYQKLNASVDRLNNITGALDAGKGTAGKLLKDDSLYNNLNKAVANTNDLVANINAGKGALGKLAKDPEFANRLHDTVTNLDELLKGINEGRLAGPAGAEPGALRSRRPDHERSARPGKGHSRESQKVPGDSFEGVLSPQSFRLKAGEDSNQQPLFPNLSSRGNVTVESTHVLPHDAVQCCHRLAFAQSKPAPNLSRRNPE